MPSSGAQTDVTVYPTEAPELRRWFRGFDEEAQGGGGFAAFKATADQEVDLVDMQDVQEISDQSRDFVVVVNREGQVLKIRRRSASGKRVLVARGAYTNLEVWEN